MWAMTASRWTFGNAWVAFRDVASWGLGAYWGNEQMTSSLPADPVKIALVATLLGLPFAFRADEIRRSRKDDHNNHQNGTPTRETTP